MKTNDKFMLVDGKRLIKFYCCRCDLHFKLDALDVAADYSLYVDTKCPKCAKTAHKCEKEKTVDFVPDF